jgi:hypothetical protein
LNIYLGAVNGFGVEVIRNTSNNIGNYPNMIDDNSRS